MRRDYRSEQVIKRFRAICRARNALCHFCVERGDTEHAQIDYSTKVRNDPNGFEADHLKPWALYPHLRYCIENLAASHRRCNRMHNQHGQKASMVSLNSVGAKEVWVKPDW